MVTFVKKFTPRRSPGFLYGVTRVNLPPPPKMQCSAPFREVLKVLGITLRNDQREKVLLGAMDPREQQAHWFRLPTQAGVANHQTETWRKNSPVHQGLTGSPSGSKPEAYTRDQLSTHPHRPHCVRAPRPWFLPLPHLP